MGPKSGSSEDKAMTSPTPASGSKAGPQSDDWKLLDGDHIDCQQLEDGGTRYKYNEEEHGQILLYNICKLWTKQKLLDVQMVSTDRKVSRYHGVLLAACSTIFRKILASEQVQMYQGMLAPKDVKSDVLDDLTSCLYRPEVFHEKMRDQSSTIKFAVYFGLEELIVNSVINTAKLLKNLHQMLEQRCMTYTILKVQQRLIPCHSVVLAVASPILRDNILAQDIGETLPYNEVEMVDHLSMVMDKLVKFIYTAELDINNETMAELLYSSCKLQMMSVVKGTCHYILQSTTPDTALRRRNIAVQAVKINQHTCCLELVQKLEDYIVDQFPNVMLTTEFGELATYDDVVKFMVKANLKNVAKVNILEALIKWYEHDRDGRVERLPLLMTVVSIIKDQQGLVQVLSDALKESQSDIYGAIAGIILMKQSFNAQTNEVHIPTDDGGTPNDQDVPHEMEAMGHTNQPTTVMQNQVVTSQG